MRLIDRGEIEQKKKKKTTEHTYEKLTKWK